ncbi:S-methyl-5-thioribose-1-phosphate isomerase [Puccinia graminis f. sp. tritici]|uniref:S-methyl-5-thioribose-1-phosphate isomerase n=1 Tax=Puccinia graminis f. sp. tritici TaxID=56615 RepID=A0A5B0PH62_PUCGR|nr:S-methyl-5-thioribose-1-phosphate isomerase [Puccinia graminis f. sp. tritici]KAA1099788.1 S-methyl-5-thioribose-1-phosphate isomerase [Puccinia graminis f. sp. tritici]
MALNNQNTSSGLLSIRMIDGKPIEETHAVEIIDQLLLPHQFEWITISNPSEAHRAIKAMNIRGAPAIGSLAALALACGLLRLSAINENLTIKEVKEYLKESSILLISARPTAVNLQEAIERVNTKYDQLEKTIEEQSGNEPEQIVSLIRPLVELCKLIWTEDVERNKKIGRLGADWLIESLSLKAKEKISVLTVCNTGSLATSGYGTALGIITALHELDRLEHTYFMQTTPYLQGARLTSLELQALSIPCSMVCDSAVGWLIQSGKVDAFIAGADRIASNGDTANKISTYQISLICKHGNNPKLKPKIPVVIAAPRTTIDLKIDSGKAIHIEERSSLEACSVRGRVIGEGQKEDLKVATVLVTPENTVALNPAFDVTPAHLIDAIATEVGVIVKDQDQDQFNLRCYFK